MMSIYRIPLARSRPLTAVLVATGLVLAAAPSAQAAAPSNWSSVPVTEIKLFYPGQSSYEWLLSKDHKKGYKKVARGESCVTCHEDEEQDLGETLVVEDRLEPTPVDGKQATIDLGLQIAYDERNVYFRAQWKTLNPHPGEAHPFKRFDGTQWQHYGYPKLDKVVQDGAQPGIYEDRFSMLIDDGSVPNFAEQGCWLTCHDGERDMQAKAGKSAVKANPVLGDSGLKKSDVRKYLPSTRTGSDWASTRSREEIAAIKSAGGFLDLMQWRGHRSNPIGMADDFYVLEYRLMDAGKGPFTSNFDKQSKQPKYMYDDAKFGRNATNVEQIRSKPTALVLEKNAVPFDANRAWKEGDLIPAYYTSRDKSKGSAADNAKATGEWTNGMWTVLWTRPLNLDNPDDKTLSPGNQYTFGFAVHDDNITTRGHHVSWPMSVGFGVQADIEASKVP